MLDPSVLIPTEIPDMNQNHYNFSDQVAVVTGGCNGIGAAVSDRMVS